MREREIERRTQKTGRISVEAESKYIYTNPSSKFNIFSQNQHAAQSCHQIIMQVAQQFAGRTPQR
jgi:hypothetical protein